jgi:hypothetical protein
MAVVPVIAVALAYSWVATGFHPFTWPMRAATALPILLALVLAWRQPDAPRASSARRYRAGLWVWATLLGLLVVWELFAYAGSPRHDHPTLSSIAETVMSTQASRALVFVAWLAVGALLVRRRRAATT